MASLLMGSVTDGRIFLFRHLELVAHLDMHGDASNWLSIIMQLTQCLCVRARVCCRVS